MLYQVLIIIYLIVALCLIGLVLIQHGKGADMGASFGAGSSATIFGSSGSGNFLTKATTWLAIAFFGLSLALGNLTANRTNTVDEWNDLGGEAVQQAAESVGDIPVSITPKAAENTDVPMSDVVTDAVKESDVPK